jgi:putative ABC transport system permease protein
VESSVLGLLGGGVGILLAELGIDVLIRLSPREIPRLADVGLDLTVLVFAVVLSLLTGIVFGLAPAFQLSRGDFQEALKEGGRSSGQASTKRGARPLLVVAEVGLAVMLVIGATLLTKSFRRLMEVDPGFRADNVLVMELVLPQTKYPEWHQISLFHSRLLERIRAMPGVRQAALGYDHPLETNWYDDFLIEGRPEPEPGEVPLAVYRPVGADYFRALGITINRGRPFSERDDPENPGAVVINQSFAAQYFPDEDPIGKRLIVDGPSYLWGEAMPRSFEIVGIAGDVRFLGLARESEPALYLPARQHPLPDMSVFVRTVRDPLELVEPLRRQVWSLDPEQPIARITTMEGVLRASIAQPRFNMLVLGLFGAAGLLLAVVGIYGLVSYTVSQRTREIGLRMALGARGGDVMRHYVGRALVLAAFGVGLGLAGAVALTRVAQSLLFGVSTTDPTTFAGVALFVTLLVLVASYVPARRASQVDCIVALRYE